jgi:hypothetical protein
MTLERLLRALEGEQQLPIEVDQVRKVILRLGLVDAIRFEEGNGRPDVLRGMLVVYDEMPKPYATDCRRIALIYINEALAADPPLRRLTACKELVNILDPQKCWTNTAEQVDDLLIRMAQPLDLQGWTPEELQDRAAELVALAVLMPMHLREKLKPLFDAGELSGHDIARLAQIPERYIGFIMADRWPGLVDIFSRG